MTDLPSKGRRGLLKAVTLGVPGTLVAGHAYAQTSNTTQPAAASSASPPPATPVNRPLKFFNPHEVQAMEAIVARLIPADDLGPGAREAGVTYFLDDQLAGAWGNGDQFYKQGPFVQGTPEQGYQLSFTPAEMFRRGLAELDSAVRAKQQKSFADLTEAEQDAWLLAMQKGEVDFSPLPAPIFFQAVLDGTIEGFFSDPQYGGNADMVGWKLVGFPGAYASFSNDIERHGVIWAGQPVSIATARAHHAKGGSHG